MWISFKQGGFTARSLTKKTVRDIIRAQKTAYGEVAELVEGTTLLTWQGVKLLEGSNPSLSANLKSPPWWGF